jgi:hypothetical protein
MAKNYKWTLDEQKGYFKIPVSLPDCDYPFVTIQSGWLYIYNGYAWDGCTPKKSVGGLFFIGTPDGHVNYKTNKPFCYYASLVHDALYQYGIGTKAYADSLFLNLLKDFPLRKLYYWAVCKFGKGKFTDEVTQPNAQSNRSVFALVHRWVCKRRRS